MSEPIAVGTIVEGKVVRIKPFGAIVSLPDNTHGLVHISHVANSFVQDINDHIAMGDIVKVKVLSYDATTGKASLSIKEALPPSAPAPKKSAPYRERDTKPDFSDSFRKPDANNNPGASFEDKFKDWLKASNERQAGLSKRNKRR